MIIDKIENAKLYYNLHPNFKRAFEALIGEDLVLGKNVIDRDNIYINFEEYTTQNPDERRFEAHKRYIDIQFVVENEERMGVCDISKTQILEPYSVERDVVFLKSDKANSILVESGYFVIFYPDDAHMPCLVEGKPQKVRKKVAKIKI